MRYLLLCLAGAAAAAEPSYVRDIQPVLQKQCQGCHQPASKSSDLDLTTFTGFAAGGKHGPAFVAGLPDESVVVRYVTGQAKPQMPLGQPALPVDQVDLIRAWIRAGAKDDSPLESKVAPGETVYHQPPVITALRFSPDGKYLAVSGNGEILLHKADGTGLVRRLPGDAERVLSLAFSKDGSLLAAAGGTPARFGEVQLWDAREGKLLRAAKLTSDTVFGGSLSPDGAKVAVGCTDNTVHVFDTTTAKELYKIGNHENWVLATVFGVDGKRLVSAGRDRSAKLIDAANGQFLENVNLLRGEIDALARHPQKDIIVTGGEDRVPYIYTMDRSKNMKIADDSTLLRKLDRQNGPILALDWSPDGKLIAVASSAPEVNLYDAETGAKVASCTGHAAGIYTVAFSPDSARLATGGFDGRVRIYEAATCKQEVAFVPVPLAQEVGKLGGAQ
jgi:mono/diheme cytochrome c family protein/roadblock/LC7 domain-containing protein